jgi:hypothetical protein
VFREVRLGSSISARLEVPSVGIGQYVHRSADGGATWARSLREIPGMRTPIVRGTVDLSRLPSRPRETVWDCVSVLPDGFGVAVNHEATDANPAKTGAPGSRANVFRTHDGGQNWHEHRLNVSWKLTDIMRRWTASPVEQFNSLVLVPPDAVVLSWEDPWLFEGAKSHVIYSRDRGDSWRYQLARLLGLFVCSTLLLASNGGCTSEQRLSHLDASAGDRTEAIPPDGRDVAVADKPGDAHVLPEAGDVPVDSVVADQIVDRVDEMAVALDVAEADASLDLVADGADASDTGRPFIQRDCTKPDDCTCAPGESCAFTCPGGDCTVACAGGSICTVSCAAPFGCSVRCSQDAQCTLACRLGLCWHNGGPARDLMCDSAGTGCL